MTLTEALSAANKATKETIGAVQNELYPQLLDLGEAELEQVFKALKASTETPLKALRRDWQSYLQANNLAPEGPSNGESAGDVLVRLALESGLELWHDLERNAWATVKVGDHQEHHQLRSKNARRFLAGLYLEKQNRAAPSQALNDALNALEAQAVFRGEMYPTFVRLATYEGRQYLDLGNEQWEAVEITSSGWSVKPSNHLPVRFRRPAGLTPLPTPTGGGKLDELAPLLNLKTDSDQWRLLVAWLLGTLQPQGRPYPVLVLTGEQGSGKSTTARMLKNLIDPNVSALRVLPRDERDLLIMAVNGHVLAFDNLSGLSPAISDSLCRLSTGGGFSVRQLYSDSEETLLDAMRPVILNGIDDFVKRQDLVSRAVLVNLPAIPEANRKTEAELWAAFEAMRPRLLGALMDAAVAALANQATVNLPNKPRLADFAVWVTAAELKLGWKAGKFMEVFDLAQKTLVSNALEAEPVAAPLMKIAEVHTKWEGNSTELLELLGQTANLGEGKRPPEGWPKTPEKLAGILSRLTPALRSVGVSVERLPRTKSERPWCICNMGTQPSPPSPTPNVPQEKPDPHAKTEGDSMGDSIAPTGDGIGATVTQPSPQPSPDKQRPSRLGDGGDGGDGFILALQMEVIAHDLG
ncbi:MAG: DNA primase [Meiothermus sp.]|nr:DNA primase [Meiothermus sp.]